MLLEDPVRLRLASDVANAGSDELMRTFARDPSSRGQLGKDELSTFSTEETIEFRSEYLVVSFGTLDRRMVFASSSGARSPVIPPISSSWR